MTSENIRPAAVRSAVLSGLVPYAEKLATTGRFALDVKRAADLSSPEAPIGMGAMHAAVRIVDRQLRYAEFATLDIVVVPPSTLAGLSSRHAKRNQQLEQSGQPTYTFTQRRKLPAGRLAVLSIASFDTSDPERVPIMHAMHLEQGVSNGTTTLRTAVIGQSQQEFLDLMDPTKSAGATDPQAVLVVDNRYDRWGDTAYFNTQKQSLQVIGFMAVSSEFGGDEYPGVMEALGARRPTELLLA